MSDTVIQDASAFRPCLVIPCYNHGPALVRTLDELAAELGGQLPLPCLVVDDGSGEETTRLLDDLSSRFPELMLVRHRQNQGKGGAVISGLRRVSELGFTHALQLDADGQHDWTDIPRLLAEARLYPQALISGAPIYDASVPKGRHYGRYFTHLWVWLETASFEIRDSMCGFRVYPLPPVLALLARKNLGQRMDFDIEVLVRLYWAGVPMRFIPTRVIYPQDGLSHFDLWRDNVRISWMHTRLVCERLLDLTWGQCIRHLHWSRTPERGVQWGLRFMLWSYDTLGRPGFRLFLFPVIGYFWLTGARQRRASADYLRRIEQYAASQGIDLPVERRGSFRHFLRFGEAMLDKLAGWRGEIRAEQIEFADIEAYRQLVARQQGALILGSHLGDLELCRALGTAFGDVTINALVFTQHAERFNRLLKAANPVANLNLIQVSELGPETGMLLKSKLDAGEWVVLVGDRTSVTRERRVLWADFLGAPAPFPQGPFALAAVLGVPVYLLFGLREQGRFRVYFELFAERLHLPRKERAAALQQLVQRYADRLQFYCLKAPLEWFNFFDFWHLSDDNTEQE
jgi:predicted LPLAT superfamily acyltransferase